MNSALSLKENYLNLGEQVFPVPCMFCDCKLVSSCGNLIGHYHHELTNQLAEAFLRVIILTTSYTVLHHVMQCNITVLQDENNAIVNITVLQDENNAIGNITVLQVRTMLLLTAL